MANGCFLCCFEVTHDLDDRLQKECETEITILQMLDHPNLWLGFCVFGLNAVRKAGACQLKPLSLFIFLYLSLSLSLLHICVYIYIYLSLSLSLSVFACRKCRLFMII